MLRILHFAYLHLERPFRWLSLNLGASRKLRNSLRQTLNSIVDLALEHEVGAVFSGGDLYEHDHFNADTATFLVEAFRRLGTIPVYLAPGNHDWFGPSSIYATAAWSSNVHVFRDRRFTPVELQEGLTLWGRAQHTPSEMEDPLEGFTVPGGGVHIALFHGSETSVGFQANFESTSHASFDSAQLETLGLHHAFLGHYHKAIHKHRFTYPGNPHPLQFGEDEGPGPVLVELEGGSIRRQTLHAADLPLVDIEVDVSDALTREEILDRVSSELEQHRGLGRVHLVGDVPPELDIRVEDLSDVTGGLDGCVFRLDLLGFSLCRSSRRFSSVSRLRTNP